MSAAAEIDALRAEVAAWKGRHEGAVAAMMADVDRLRAALKWFADEYERTHFIRAEDMHDQGCRCLRCANDNARAALAKAEKEKK